MDNPIGTPSTGEEELLERLRSTGRLKGIPQDIIDLRQKLALKAKKEPKFRFYSLYHYVCNPKVLMAAWRLVKRNGGAPGIDNITIKSVEEKGVEDFVMQIQTEMSNKTYKPEPVRRVFIPKSDGKLRPLGIPTLKDRVVQTAAMLVLEPIFEADFLDCSYGFRPGKRAHEAVKEVARNIKAGRTYIYDADLKGYFDSIPHDKLMACVRMRVVDSAMLKLIRMWLTVPIVTEEGGKKNWEKPKQGTPQGGVISPLLANLYLHWFDKVFHAKGAPGQTIKARLVRYADDFVVLTRYKSNQVNEYIRSKIEEWMGLKINLEKTRQVELTAKGQSIQFLGFTLKFVKSKFKGTKDYLKISPSKKSMERAKGRIKELTCRRWNCKPVKEIIKQVNLFLAGWTNYFFLGYPHLDFRKIDQYVEGRLVRHLRRRSQRGYKLRKGETWYRALKELELIRISSGEGEAFRKAVCEKFARTV